MASPTTAPTSAVVEVLVSSPGFTDAEHVAFPDDKAARVFARDVMQYAVTGGEGRRRRKAALPPEPQERS